ncbi:MAG: ATP-binding domain-containing protein, partial [Duodenibacillus sp.]
KGREFDAVFLALATDAFKNDAVRRAVYVGLTRAKTALFVHWTGRGFRPFEVEGIVCREETAQLPPPTELTLPLGLEDVWLDWFLDKKAMLLRLRSGAVLRPTDRGELVACVDGVEHVIVRLSRACLARIGQLRASGFVLVGADIAFIVAWRRRDREEEDAVVLPNLYFQRDCAERCESAMPAAASSEKTS